MGGFEAAWFVVYKLHAVHFCCFNCKKQTKKTGERSANPASVPGRSGLQRVLLSVSSARSRTERITTPSGVSRATGSAISCWSSALGHRASSSKHSRDLFGETGSLSSPLAARKLLPDVSPWVLRAVEAVWCFVTIFIRVSPTLWAPSRLW